MPRKKATEPAADKVKSSEVRPAITQKKLRSLLASARSTKANVDEIVGSHRSEIALAVENNHLHKGAFAMVKRLDRLEPEKLADWLDCIDHYLDISGLRDRASSVQRLQMGEGEGEDGDDDDNVEPFPRQAAE